MPAATEAELVLASSAAAATALLRSVVPLTSWVSRCETVTQPGRHDRQGAGAVADLLQRLNETHSEMVKRLGQIADLIAAVPQVLRDLLRQIALGDGGGSLSERFDRRPMVRQMTETKSAMATPMSGKVHSRPLKMKDATWLRTGASGMTTW